MPRRDGQGAVNATATELAWQMTATLQAIPMAAASKGKAAASQGKAAASQGKAAALEGGGA